MNYINKPKKIPSLLVNKLVKKVFKIRSFWQKESLEKQEKLLFKLIKKSKNTTFGKIHWFKNIKNIKDFQNNVPISEYKDFESRIKYMLKWEKNISYPWRIPLFAISSGTTWKCGKYIPITKENIKNSQLRWWQKLLSWYCKQNPKTKIFTWHTIAIWGTFIQNPYTKKNNVWYITAILQKKTPLIWKLFKKPTLKTSLIENREKKSEKIIKETLNTNITAITWQPSRCTQFLYKVLEKTWKKNIHEIRPNLEVFFWWWMAVDLYKENLKELFPNKNFQYRQSYNASEWFFAIQNQNNSNDMLLMTDNWVFYEFIPRHEFWKTNPKILTLQETKLNEEYVLVITNNSWLRRYIIWDTIKFTEIEQNYKIKITGRTKFFVDVVWERLTLDHVQEAISYATLKTWSIILDYTLWPIAPTKKNKWKHEWIIEFEKKPKNIEDFSKFLDESLCKANDIYNQERNYTKVLASPQIKILKKWTFQKRLDFKNKVSGQSKIPKISNNREIINEINFFTENFKRIC